MSITQVKSNVRVAASFIRGRFRVCDGTILSHHKESRCVPIFRSVPRRRLLAVPACICLLFAGLAGAVPSEPSGAPSPLPNEAAAAGAGDLRTSAMAAYEKGAYAEALPQLKEVHALNPQDVEAAGRLGFAAKETGAYETALAALESAVQLKGDDYYYWWWLSDTQRLLGKYAEALKSMECARDLAPAEAREELGSTWPIPQSSRTAPRRGRTLIST